MFKESKKECLYVYLNHFGVHLKHIINQLYFNKLK